MLLVGAGGLGSGSVAALYLAAAGIGHIGLVDFDVVDVTNLQRQILHGTKDIGRAKLASAAERIADINPFVELTPYETALTSRNALDIIEQYDLVVDGTDNFPTRYLVNDACVMLGKPDVYGSVFRFEGQASVFATQDGPCYRCLFPAPPPPGVVPSCAEGGVLGVLPGLIGTIQATEALKLILGIGEPLVGRLLLVDALTAQFRSVKVRRDPTCPACGTREITELIDYEEFCGMKKPEAGGRKPGNDMPEITPLELAERLHAGDVELIDVREPYEWDIARIPGARLIPLGEFPAAIPSLDRDRDIVVQCRSGVRSANAVRQLQAAGFTRVQNLAGRKILAVERRSGPGGGEVLEAGGRKHGSRARAQESAVRASGFRASGLRLRLTVGLQLLLHACIVVPREQRHRATAAAHGFRLRLCDVEQPIRVVAAAGVRYGCKDRVAFLVAVERRIEFAEDLHVGARRVIVSDAADRLDPAVFVEIGAFHLLAHELARARIAGTRESGTPVSASHLCRRRPRIP